MLDEDDEQGSDDDEDVLVDKYLVHWKDKLTGSKLTDDEFDKRSLAGLRKRIKRFQARGETRPYAATLGAFEQQCVTAMRLQPTCIAGRRWEDVVNDVKAYNAEFKEF